MSHLYRGRHQPSTAISDQNITQRTATTVTKLNGVLRQRCMRQKNHRQNLEPMSIMAPMAIFRHSGPALSSRSIHRRTTASTPSLTMLFARTCKSEMRPLKQQLDTHTISDPYMGRHDRSRAMKQPNHHTTDSKHSEPNPRSINRSVRLSATVQQSLEPLSSVVPMAVSRPSWPT